MQHYYYISFYLFYLCKKVFLLFISSNKSCQGKINLVKFVLEYVYILFFPLIFQIQFYLGNKSNFAAE